MMQKFNRSMALVLLGTVSGVTLVPSQAALASFTFTNSSPYYLYNVNKDAGCPGTDWAKPIKPGDTVTSSADWCGFDACTSGGNAAGPGFSSSGCLETNTAGQAPNVQGGYVSWFSLSKTAGCGIDASHPYSCHYDSTSEKPDFTMNFKAITQVYSAGDKAGQPVTVGDAKHFNSLPYRGINISGLEYDGTYGDAMYQKPDLPEVKYFLEQNMNTVRLPIRWEFVLTDSPNTLAESHSPTSGINNDSNHKDDNLNKEYMSAVIDTVTKLLKGSGNNGQGMKVIVDLHNYMRFCGTGANEGQSNEPTDPNQCTLVTPEQMSYIWGVLAEQLSDLAKQYPDQLIFGLMNEPNPDANHPLTTQQVFDNEVAAYQAIRAKGLTNLVIFSGNYWDPMHGWTTQAANGDVPNGSVFTKDNFAAQGIDVDTANIALEMHQYFDSNYSGLSSTCNTYSDLNDFATQLNVTDLPKWLNDNHLKVLLTEFGAADNATCQADLNYMLQFMEKYAYGAEGNPDGGFLGWTAWRVNRHGSSSTGFNFLQQADYTVYGATGSASTSAAGTGIVQGAANALMDSVFKPHLQD